MGSEAVSFIQRHVMASAIRSGGLACAGHGENAASRAERLYLSDNSVPYEDAASVRRRYTIACRIGGGEPMSRQRLVEVRCKWGQGGTGRSGGQ